MAIPLGAHEVAPLLELDPELGALLPPDLQARAAREVRVRVSTFPTGEWQGTRLVEIDPGHVGLLLVDGVLAREVVLASQVSTELLGPGDVLRPWHLDEVPRLLPVSVRWNALAPLRLALIDRRAAVQLAAYPEISAALVDRVSERAQRLAVTQAISQLNRVTERLTALFWHLAERWGRVGPDGVVVPLALSHRLLGELVGARRPSVSTALAELAHTGQVIRRDNGTWVLGGEAIAEGIPDGGVIRQRRRLIPAEPAGDPEPERPEPPAPRMAELRVALHTAHEISRETARDFEALRSESAALQERSAALRIERLRSTRRP